MAPIADQSEQRTCAHKGCALAYRVRGEGPPALFIQGVGVHGDGWLPQVEALHTTHACLTFDNRGVGRSQPCVGSLSVERMAEDALALMDAAEWESAHIVGHSMGGLIAQRLALVARPRVRSLSLLCTFANGRDATRLTARMAWIGLRTRVGTARRRRAAFLELILAPGDRAGLSGAALDALAARLAPLFGHDLASQPGVSMKQLRAMRRCDLTDRLGELIGLPTLVVSATHDPISPPTLGKAIVDAIRTGNPGAPARFVEIEDASHGVTILRADRVNALLLEQFSQAPVIS